MEAVTQLPLVNAVAHSVAQLAVGISAGIVMDYSFMRLAKIRQPGKELSTAKDAMIEAIEAAGQIALGSILIGAVFNFLSGLDFAYSDPSSGYIFAQFFVVAQPGLLDRVARLTSYARRRWLAAENTLESQLLDTGLMDGSRGRSNVSMQGVSRVQTTARQRQTGQIPPHITQSK